MKYFNECQYKEEAKLLYIKLVKRYHPDNGGNVNIMAEINAEFMTVFKKLKNRPESEESNKNYKTKTDELPEKFVNITSYLCGFNGIEIELCGNWIWLSGNTFPYKEDLKQAGCRWSKSKKKWYWTEDSYSKYRKSYSMDYIRSKYGSQSINKERYKTQQITG